MMLDSKYATSTRAPRHHRRPHRRWAGLVATCMLLACAVAEDEDPQADPWRILEDAEPAPDEVLDGMGASGAGTPASTWTRTGGGNLPDRIWDLALSDDGQYLVAVGEESTNNPATFVQGLVLVLNTSDGSTHCSQTLGTNGIDSFRGVDLDGDAIYVAGARALLSHDVPYVARLSLTDCSVQWNSTYKFTLNTSAPEIAFDVEVDGPGGNLMVVGAGSLSGNQGVPFTAELSPNGAVLRNPNVPIPPISVIRRVERLELSPTDRRWALLGASSSGPTVLEISTSTLLPIAGTGRVLTGSSSFAIRGSDKNRFMGEEVLSVNEPVLTSLSGTLATTGSFSIPAVTPLPVTFGGVGSNTLGVICTGGTFTPQGQDSLATMLTFLATPNPTLVGGNFVPSGLGATTFETAAAGDDGCYAAGTTANGGDTDWYVAKTGFLP